MCEYQAFVDNALASALAGAAIAKVGYLAVLSSAAVTAVVAAIVFQTLLRDTTQAGPVLAHSRS